MQEISKEVNRLYELLEELRVEYNECSMNELNKFGVAYFRDYMGGVSYTTADDPGFNEIAGQYYYTSGPGCAKWVNCFRDRELTEPWNKR